jgi:hypothetical protein
MQAGCTLALGLYQARRKLVGWECMDKSYWGEHHALGDVLDILQLSLYDATTTMWHHDACLCRAVERILYGVEVERAV